VSVKQIYPLVALAVLLAGGWFFFSNFQVDVSDTAAGPQVRPRDASGQGDGPTTGLPPLFGGSPSPPATANPGEPAVNVPVSVPGRQAPIGGDVIRIASFNIEVFGEAKLAKPEVVQVLANIVRNFDIVAVQEVRAQSQHVLPSFVQAVNAANLRYDFVIGERIGRTSSKEQYAYIFNTDTVEVDRRTLYTVADPDDLLHREPFVAWFRCRNADPQQAFTFSLVNIHTDPDEVDLRRPNNELDVLDDVFRAVRDDGRGEDDVILLGDFNASDRDFGHLARLAGIRWVVSNTATNTRGTAQYDNLVFDQTATQEFLGRGGVFDFMREYNLSLKQAETVSDHLPVWAEFSVYEGGVPGRVASRTNPYAPRTTAAGGYALQPNVTGPDGYVTHPRIPAQQAPRYDATDDPRYAPAPAYTADPRYPGDWEYGPRSNAYSPYAEPAPAHAPPRTARPSTRW
jgi:deoxyribonuclease-1-like protein